MTGSVIRAALAAAGFAAGFAGTTTSSLNTSLSTASLPGVPLPPDAPPEPPPEPPVEPPPPAAVPGPSPPEPSPSEPSPPEPSSSPAGPSPAGPSPPSPRCARTCQRDHRPWLAKCMDPSKRCALCGRCAGKGAPTKGYATEPCDIDLWCGAQFDGEYYHQVADCILPFAHLYAEVAMETKGTGRTWAPAVGCRLSVVSCRSSVVGVHPPRSLASDHLPPLVPPRKWLPRRPTT